MAGVDVPENTKILIGEVESVDISEEFAHEKLSPVLAMYKAKTFDEALAKAEQLCSRRWIWTYICSVCSSGTDRKDRKTLCSNEDMPCSRSTHLQLRVVSEIFTTSNWLHLLHWDVVHGAETSVSENVGVKHLINVKTVAESEREHALVQNT